MRTTKLGDLVQTRLGVGLVIAMALLLAVAGTVAMFSPVSAQGSAPDPTQGILVAAVQPDSPADAAGVVRGDIIQAVNGEPVNRVPELMQAIQSLDGNTEAAAEVELEVLHGDELRTLTVTFEGDSRTLGIVPIGADAMLEQGVPGQGMPGEGMPGMPFGRQFELPGGTAQLPPMEEFMQRMRTPGALIVEVVPGGPADEAGLQPGDVIVAVDGEELTADSELADMIASYAPGDEITLEIAQGNVMTDSLGIPQGDDAEGDEPSAGADTDSDTDVDTFEVVVTLGENEEGNALLGVRYTFMGAFRFSPDMLPDLEGMPPFAPNPDGSLPFDEPQEDEDAQGDTPQNEDGQVVVMQVAPDSPAAQVGLQPGDVIMAVDGEEIRSPEELVDAIGQLEPGDEVTLSILGADGEEMELVVALGENDEGAAFLGVGIGSMPRSEP